MTAQEIPHPWQEIQRVHGVEVTAVNPLELGRPFQFTDPQRATIQPYLEAAGDHGAVLVVVTRSAFENYLHATPLAVSAKNRRTLSATLTRLKKETHATIHPTRP